MYIGSLLAKDTGANITYTYKKGGSGERVYPDLYREKEEKDIYSSGGCLFTDKVGFNGSVLYSEEVDICIELGKKCYIDHIFFKQFEQSEIGEISVLTKSDGEKKKIGCFAPETGETIRSTDINIETGAYADNLILRLKAEYIHIIIGGLDIFGATEIEDAVYPLPKEINLSKGYFTKIDSVSAEGEAVFAAENFIEKYNNLYKKEIKAGKGSISFEIADTGEEQFDITVTEDEVLVKGGSRRALLYASEKLLQLSSEKGIRICEIHDEPFMEFRGVHLALPDRKEIPFLKRMVKYVFMPMGYNTLFLQISGAMEYKSHPEIAEGWHNACKKCAAGEWPVPAHYKFVGHDILTQDEVKDLCDYFREYGFEIIPEVQSFAHTQYITISHPELAEIEPSEEEEDTDLYLADKKPDAFYHHNMCPNHPGYYDMIFDLMDEVIDVVKPERYVHIGHDEIYVMGKCDRCKNIPADEIFAKEVTILYNHLKEKGLGTMMWSDMIQEKGYESSKAIDKIPKDIICLSFTWYFHLDEDIEVELPEHGYKYLIGNFYSSHFPRFDKRKYGEGLIGGEVSTWVVCSEESYAFEGKTYDFIYSANMLWNEGYCQDMRRTYGEIINKRLPLIREKISGVEVAASEKGKIDFLKDSDAPYDIFEYGEGILKAGCGETREISINSKVKKLSFVHATDKGGRRVPWTEADKLGEYVIEYADGTQCEAEILYGANICEYKRTYAKPIPSPLFRHEGYIATCLANPIMGKTAEGKDYTLYEFAWINPDADKEIKKVYVKNTSNKETEIMVFDVKYER